MKRRPTPKQIISHALALLNAGLLPSALPDKLREEYPFLSPAQARDLATKAVKQHKKGKLDTKPLDQGSK